MLHTVCEAEQWDDALVELERQSFVRSVREYEQAIRLTPFVRPEDLRAQSDCFTKTNREHAAEEIAKLAEHSKR